MKLLSNFTKEKNALNTLKPKIYLAPFQGITNNTFRTVFSKHFKGVDALFTPFFLNISNENKLPPKKASELENTKVNGIEVVPQILSKNAEEITRFIHFCALKGFKEVNWNLGCPFPQVANKKRGSGLMPFPDEIDDILQKVMPTAGIRFSVKCRLGYHDSKEILELAPIFNHHKISELTLHARIGKQLYSGTPDLLSFRKALSLLTIPVVYNGDICTLADYRKLEKELPEVNTWMIGRGVLSNPFLPASIKCIPLEADQTKMIQLFIQDLYLTYRRKMNDRLTVLSVLKEYWEYLAQGFDQPHKIFKNIKKTRTFEEYESKVTQNFENYVWLGSQ